MITANENQKLIDSENNAERRHKELMEALQYIGNALIGVANRIEDGHIYSTAVQIVNPEEIPHCMATKKAAAKKRGAK